MGDVKYIVKSEGDLLNNYSAEQVLKNISRLFDLEDQDIKPLLEKKIVFIKSGLDEFTAKEYVTTLTRAGLKVNLSQDTHTAKIHDVGTMREAATKDAVHRKSVVEQVSPAQELSNNKRCKKCNSPITNEIKCDSCGVYFDKLKQTLDNKTINDSEPVKELSERYKIARFLLKLGALTLTVSFIVDNYLTDLIFVEHSGFDMGQLPYLFGHVVLSAGSYMYAVAKGVSWVLRYISVFSIVGLSIILFFDKHEGEVNGKEQLKIKAMSLVVIVISVLWFYDTKQTDLEMDQFYQLVEHASGSRSNYPHGIDDDITVAVPAALSNLYEVVDSGFILLIEYDLNPDKVSEIANTMLDEAASYVYWLNYQRYLYYSINKSLPEVMSTKSISATTKDIFNYIDTKYKISEKSDDMPVRFNSDYHDWQFGFSRYGAHAERINVASALNNALREFYDDISDIKVPEGISYELDGDIIKITVNANMAKETVDQNVVFVRYQEKILNNNGSAYSFVNMDRIGGNMTNRYFTSNFNVFIIAAVAARSRK